MWENLQNFPFVHFFYQIKVKNDIVRANSEEKSISENFFEYFVPKMINDGLNFYFTWLHWKGRINLNVLDISKFNIFQMHDHKTYQKPEEQPIKFVILTPAVTIAEQWHLFRYGEKTWFKNSEINRLQMKNCIWFFDWISAFYFIGDVDKSIFEVRQCESTYFLVDFLKIFWNFVMNDGCRNGWYILNFNVF